MRKKREDVRIVYAAMLCVAAFLAGYIFRSWREATAPAAGQPSGLRCGQTDSESDLLNGYLDTKPLYVLPTEPVVKTGTYM
jgi:hypothetical protein